MDRRSSISAYNYSLGDEAKAEHIDFTKTNQYYAHEVKKLDVGHSVFIKRSANKKWSFAEFIEKSTDEDGDAVYTYQIGQNHKFESFREHQLGECVRLVEVCQRASFSKLDINQSTSCESYTDRAARFNSQKKLSSQTGIIDIKSNSAGDRDDKENMPHTNNCNNATKSVAVSELSMASPVENVMKQRRSENAAQLGESNASTSNRIEHSSQPRIPKSISTRGAVKQQLSPPFGHMNLTEEQYEEQISHMLDDLLVSEALITEDQSKQRIQRQKLVSSTHRSSLPAYSSRRNHSVASTTRRKSLAMGSRNEKNNQSRMNVVNAKLHLSSIDDNKTYKKQEKEESEIVDSAQLNTDNFNGAKSDPEIVFTPSDEAKETDISDTCHNFKTTDWRAKSDPEIVFMPNEEKDAVESDTASNFDTANWRAKSDHEIVVMPSEEKENNDQENHDQKRGQKESTSSTSTALVLYPSSKLNSSNLNPDDSAGGKQCGVNEQTRTSEGKKRWRNIFSGTTFFAKKFRKKASSKKSQPNPAPVTDCKGTKAANSTFENNRSSDPSVYPTVSQTNDHARPNSSSYTAAAGFVPNYYPNQNVYYVTDRRLAQAYRDYAHHAMRAQATQCVYNSPTFAQFSYQMTGHGGRIGLPPVQPTSICVGTNGITGANYRITSVGHGVQIGVPTNSPNIMYINF